LYSKPGLTLHGTLSITPPLIPWDPFCPDFQASEKKHEWEEQSERERIASRLHTELGAHREARSHNPIHEMRT